MFVMVERRLTAIAQGWKPGAVSKRILKKLNRARQRSAAVMDSTPTKKTKRKCDNKPTLTISKKEGEYTVEMQVTSEKDPNCMQYDPLIYKIASASNDKKIRRREKKAKLLIRNLIQEFDDPFHPEVCQEACLRSYKEATNMFNDAPDKGDGNALSSETCSCEEDIESDGSSLDLDWEIQVSPPNARVR